MENKKLTTNEKMLEGVNTYRFVLRNMSKENDESMTKKEKGLLIDKIILKAQNNKISIEEGNQISKLEFESIPWECWPSKE